MKSLLLLLCLTFAPQIQKSEETIALIFHDQVEIVKLSDARAEYARLKALPELTESQNARLVALTFSLGTYPGTSESLPRNTDIRAFLDNEIRRGVRRPAQANTSMPQNTVRVRRPTRRHRHIRMRIMAQSVRNLPSCACG